MIDAYENYCRKKSKTIRSTKLIHRQEISFAQKTVQKKKTAHHCKINRHILTQRLKCKTFVNFQRLVYTDGATDTPALYCLQNVYHFSIELIHCPWTVFLWPFFFHGHFYRAPQIIHGVKKKKNIYTSLRDTR